MAAAWGGWETGLSSSANAAPPVAAVVAAEQLTVNAVVPGSNCHPSYEPCIPDGPALDCPQIGHRVMVVGPDEYRLNADPNTDDIGCDTYPEPSA